MSHEPNRAVPPPYHIHFNPSKPYSIKQNATTIPNEIHPSIQKNYHQGKPVIHS